MIKAAAIKVGDKIYEGTRHYKLIEIALNDNPELSRVTYDMQGFITDDGRFINDREEAAKIAYEYGQIKEPKRILFSEDIFKLEVQNE